MLVWTIDLLTKRRKLKIKKTSRQDNFNFFSSHPFPIQYLRKCIWNHFHIKYEDLKNIMEHLLLTKVKKMVNQENCRAGTKMRINACPHI